MNNIKQTFLIAGMVITISIGGLTLHEKIYNPEASSRDLKTPAVQIHKETAEAKAPKLSAKAGVGDGEKSAVKPIANSKEKEEAAGNQIAQNVKAASTVKPAPAPEKTTAKPAQKAVAGSTAPKPASVAASGSAPSASREGISAALPDRGSFSRTRAENPAPATGPSTPAVSAPTYTQDQLYWLAKMIMAEAEGEVYEGKVAVGAVILNRVQNPRFPNTIYEVIFDAPDGYVQFSPVLDGRIWQVEPNEECYAAAKEALSGNDPSWGSLYFYNPEKSENPWVFNLRTIRVIGGHVFATDE